ncbi:MAG: dihydrolipoyl dehydrogenase, partial [Paracoccaceae bacterium]
MAAKNFDMIVIGAGPGGYVAAIRAAQLGLSVAIIERENLGGICLNWGCIPTKALLRSAEVFHLMHRAKEFGLSVSGLSYDLDAVVARSRGVAKQLSGGIGHLMKKNKITVFMGAATIPAKGHVSVKTDKGSEDLTAKSIILATGARARELPGLEADGDLVWTYRHALQPKRMPKKLLVIGSGAIGIEFASFFNTLGADVTVVEVMDRVLPVEDAEISAFAKKAFLKQGMKIMEKAAVKKLDRAPDGKGGGKVTAHIEQDGKTQTMDFDTVISAVGIVGNVENLGLEALGVKIDRTHVVTDEFCRTGIDGLFAIGDIAGAPWLAHKASHEGVMVAELIAGKHPHPIKPGSI